MKLFVGVSLLSLACAGSGGCAQKSQPALGLPSSQERQMSVPSRGTDAGAKPPAALAALQPDPLPTEYAGECSPLLDTLAACAAQQRCDEGMAMFLPSAARDQLIAAERLPGFSEDAFDRYCLRACQTRSATVNEREFARDVCEVPAASGQSGASGETQRQGVALVAFVLGNDLQIGEHGVALATIEQVLGRPQQDTVTPFECDSAFAEGRIRQWTYPELVLETDGHTALVRSMRLQSGNRMLLSTGESVGRIDEAEFQRRFGAFAQRVGGAYRVGAGVGGDWEAAYDFHFEHGLLVRVDYWIGC